MDGYEEGNMYASDIPTVIDLINADKNYQAFECTFVRISELQTGDIAITNAPLTITAIVNGYATTKTTNWGHAFVVDEVFTDSKQRKSFRDDDDLFYCDFDEYYIQGGYRITKNSN